MIRSLILLHRPIDNIKANKCLLYFHNGYKYHRLYLFIVDDIKYDLPKIVKLLLVDSVELINMRSCILIDVDSSLSL